MIWSRTHRADRRCAQLADRHYPRQSIGHDQFLAPGRCVVLHAQTKDGEAAFAMLDQRPEFVDHDWPNAWINALFRNETQERASVLIRQAIAATIFEWGQPAGGIVTFIDRQAVRQKKNPGHCYIIAGFRPVGETKSGKLVLMMADRFPAPAPALRAQHMLWGAA